MITAFGQQALDVEPNFSMATGNDNLHCSKVLTRRQDERQVTYAWPVSPHREPVRKNSPAQRYDRAIAMGIWVVIGLMVGLALGVFTGHGWLFLAIGLVTGVLLAISRTRPGQTIDED